MTRNCLGRRSPRPADACAAQCPGLLSLASQDASEVPPAPDAAPLGRQHPRGSAWSLAGHAYATALALAAAAGYFSIGCLLLGCCRPGRAGGCPAGLLRL